MLEAILDAGSDLVVEDRLEREQRIVDGDRLAVTPANSLAQVEGPGEVVVGDVPRFRHFRTRLPVAVVVVDQPGEDDGADLLVCGAFRFDRIESIHLSEDGVDESTAVGAGTILDDGIGRQFSSEGRCGNSDRNRQVWFWLRLT